MLGKLTQWARPKPKFSIVVIFYDMHREIRRTLKSLQRDYQWGIEHIDYEVIVVDNGSPTPLSTSEVESYGPEFRLITIEDASKSPAKAMNIGGQNANGEYLCMMVDGAHVLTPGVLHYADLATRIYQKPIVTPHYFFTGPGQQNQTVLEGYNQYQEDLLFEKIDWPNDGYKMFEIGKIIGENITSWFMEKFECNCLFIDKSDFFKNGGVNEAFSVPGGGLVNLDLYKRMVEGANRPVVGILGEGTFHQVHGGDTTNSHGAIRKKKISEYHNEYFQIYQHSYSRPKVNIQYVGHMPSLFAMCDAVET
jgi:glycosyltransferase involved in cell wall biosynthesis